MCISNVFDMTKIQSTVFSVLWIPIWWNGPLLMLVAFYRFHDRTAQKGRCTLSCNLRMILNAVTFLWGHAQLKFRHFGMVFLHGLPVLNNLIFCHFTFLHCGMKHLLKCGP